MPSRVSASSLAAVVAWVRVVRPWRLKGKGPTEVERIVCGAKLCERPTEEEIDVGEHPFVVKMIQPVLCGRHLLTSCVSDLAKASMRERGGFS